MKDIREYKHEGRTEYYSNSLFDIAEVIDPADREKFIKSGKAILDEVKPVYGVKEFFVTVYENGTVTGEIVTGSEVIREFYRK